MVCFRRYGNLVAVGVSALPPNKRDEIKFKRKFSQSKAYSRARKALASHLNGHQSRSTMNRVFDLSAKNAYHPKDLVNHLQIIMDDGVPTLVI